MREALTLAAAAASAGAIATAWPSPRALLWLRLDSAPQARSRLAPTPRAGGAVAVGILAVVFVCLCFVSLSAALLSATAAAGALLALHLWLAGRRRRRIVAAKVETVEIIDALAETFRSGLGRDVAFARIGGEFSCLSGVTQAVAHGGDLPAALRAAGTQAGREALDAVAAGLDVADETGAPLARVLTTITFDARDELQSFRQVQTAAAPARATAQLLAVLPLVGFALSSSLGARPVHTVTSNPIAAAAVSAGVGLSLLGVWWIERLVTRVESA